MNKDVVWYIGFILGAAGMGVLLTLLNINIHSIFKLILVLGAGVGCGWLSEAAWAPKKK